MDEYVYIPLSQLIAIIFLMGMSVGLLLVRAVKDVLAWRQWLRRRHLARPPPVDGWKVRVPRERP